MTAKGVPEWLFGAFRKSGIYAITHRDSGRMYIGSAANIRARMQKHLWHLVRNSHHSSRLQNAFNKYGAESFDRDVVEYVDDPARLIEREQTWIDFFMPFYNIERTAGSSLGVRRTDEYKARMSQIKRGSKMTESAKAAISAYMKGRKKPEGMGAKVSAARKGMVFSAETRARMSASAKLRHREKDSRGRYA